MKKKILITGSSGYIGRHLCSVLQHDYVVGLDYVFQKQMTDDFVLQDINKDIWNDQFEHFDVVVHLAALVNVAESMQKPLEYFKTNVSGTLKVLENTSFDHFIFASTGAAENPISPYALSKLQTESLVREYCRIKKLNHTIFRFYNVIGSNGYDPTNPDGLMYNLMKAGDTGVFNLYGDNYATHDGTAIRDYVHVLEICESIQRAIVQPPVNGVVENLGSGTGHTVQEIVDAFKVANGCDFKVNYLPRREGDLPVSRLADVSPYMQKRFTLEQMLRIKK